MKIIIELEADDLAKLGLAEEIVNNLIKGRSAEVSTSEAEPEKPKRTKRQATATTEAGEDTLENVSTKPKVSLQMIQDLAVIKTAISEGVKKEVFALRNEFGVSKLAELEPSSFVDFYKRLQAIEEPDQL